MKKTIVTLILCSTVCWVVAASAEDPKQPVNSEPFVKLPQGLEECAGTTSHAGGYAFVCKDRTDSAQHHDTFLEFDKNGRLIGSHNFNTPEIQMNLPSTEHFRLLRKTARRGYMIRGDSIIALSEQGKLLWSARPERVAENEMQQMAVLDDAVATFGLNSNPLRLVFALHDLQTGKKIEDWAAELPCPEDMICPWAIVPTADKGIVGFYGHPVVNDFYQIDVRRYSRRGELIQSKTVMLPKRQKFSLKDLVAQTRILDNGDYLIFGQDGVIRLTSDFHVVSSTAREWPLSRAEYKRTLEIIETKTGGFLLPSKPVARVQVNGAVIDKLPTPPLKGFIVDAWLEPSGSLALLTDRGEKVRVSTDIKPIFQIAPLTELWKDPLERDHTLTAPIADKSQAIKGNEADNTHTFNIAGPPAMTWKFDKHGGEVSIRDPGTPKTATAFSGVYLFKDQLHRTAGGQVVALVRDYSNYVDSFRNSRCSLFLMRMNKGGLSGTLYELPRQLEQRNPSFSAGDWTLKEDQEGRLQLIAHQELNRIRVKTFDRKNLEVKSDATFPIYGNREILTPVLVTRDDGIVSAHNERPPKAGRPTVQKGTVDGRVVWTRDLAEAEWISALRETKDGRILVLSRRKVVALSRIDGQVVSEKPLPPDVLNKLSEPTIGLDKCKGSDCLLGAALDDEGAVFVFADHVRYMPSDNRAEKRVGLAQPIGTLTDLQVTTGGNLLILEEIVKVHPIAHDEFNPDNTYHTGARLVKADGRTTWTTEFGKVNRRIEWLPSEGSRTMIPNIVGLARFRYSGQSTTRFLTEGIDQSLIFMLDDADSETNSIERLIRVDTSGKKKDIGPALNGRFMFALAPIRDNNRLYFEAAMDLGVAIIDIDRTREADQIKFVDDKITDNETTFQTSQLLDGRLVVIGVGN